MPSIKITQDIKDKNDRYNYTWLSNAVVDDIVLRGLPDKFFVTEPISGGYPTRTDLHEADGWQTPVIPNGYNPETQRLGAIVDIDGIHTYTLIGLTQQEIEQRLRSQSESNKQQIVQIKAEEQAVEQAQTLDDADAVAIIDIYPEWAVGQIYTLNNKLKYIVGSEYWLFKVNQPTLTTDAQNPPPTDGSSNALYTRIPFPNQILDWQQPTGAQDAYAIGDKVYYPIGTQDIWISKIDANTTVPDGDVPFNRYWEPFIP